MILTEPTSVEHSAGRVGNWMQTYTGMHFFPQDPRPEDVNIIDIAHSLSLQCRYAGHTTKFYSVAQHSVLVAQYLPQDLKLWGLLHDASEAYLVDLPRPVKHFARVGVEYSYLEDMLMQVICQQFNLKWPAPPIIKHTDNLVLMTEARDLMNNPQDWTKYGDPFKEVITPWAPEHAEWEFLKLAKELGVQYD